MCYDSYQDFSFFFCNYSLDEYYELFLFLRISFCCDVMVLV